MKNLPNFVFKVSWHSNNDNINVMIKPIHGNKAVGIMDAKGV